MTDILRLASISTPSIAVYPPGATFGPRALVDYEFVWMIEGNAQYVFDGQIVPAPEGSFVLCKPGVTDAFIWDPRRRTRHGYCHFTIDSVPSALPDPSEWPILRTTGEVRVLESVFQYLLSVGLSKDPIRLETAISLLVVAFVTTEEANTLTERVLPDSVERVLGYIKDRLDIESDAKITLSEMATVALCTKEHLCRVFGDALGLTPAECVRLSRLDRSATMLARSNFSISEISSLYGFSNPSHFTKRFEEEYGASPADFRKMLRTGGRIPPSRLQR